MAIFCFFLSCLGFSLPSTSLVAAPTDVWMAIDPLLVVSPTLLTGLVFHPAGCPQHLLIKAVQQEQALMGELV